MPCRFIALHLQSNFGRVRRLPSGPESAFPCRISIAQTHRRTDAVLVIKILLPEFCVTAAYHPCVSSFQSGGPFPLIMPFSVVPLTRSTLCYIYIYIYICSRLIQYINVALCTWRGSTTDILRGGSCNGCPLRRTIVIDATPQTPHVAFIFLQSWNIQCSRSFMIEA
jgi:hypothetical protein